MGRFQEEDGMGFSGLAPSAADRAGDRRIEQAVKAERERCAKIAKAHDGTRGATSVFQGIEIAAAIRKAP